MERKTLSRKNKIIIAVSSILSILFIVLISAYLMVGSYFFKYALDATYATSNDSLNLAEDFLIPDMQNEWFEDVDKTSKNIYSDDGYKLHAYQIMAPVNLHNWAIIVHGYRSEARHMNNYAYRFYMQGFNILMPDLEGHGLSEGKYIGMGYTDRFDLLKWIDLIIDQDAQANIVLHGVSMGASTVMMTTGEELPENVVCAIEDCGYSNVYDQFAYVMDNVLDLPFKKIIMSSAEIYVKMRLGRTLKDMDVINSLKNSTTPTLFIHGDQDDFVPFDMLDVVYNANPNLDKEKLVVEGAGHGYSATANPDLYFNTIFDFINKHLN